jgi:hypothetical protein
MATGTQFVTRALGRLGIKAAETSLEASELQDGLDSLNDMLINWEESGYLMGFSPIANLTDEVRVPRGANAAIIDSLAIVLAPEYSRPISPALAASAEMHFNNMLNAIVHIGAANMPSTLPKGAGNEDIYTDNRTFFSDSDKENF